jgi:DNA-binding LacI/PurR family transcriptional regulator
MAFGVIKRLNELKIRVPQDIAVIGYDNVPFSSVISPSLTTIDQPIMTMCIQGTDTLFKVIKREGGIKNKITLEPSIVIRQSAP